MILTHQKGRGKKIHLLLDDEYQITTDIDFWADNYIKNGTEIDEDEWEELVVKINYKKAVNKCYDLLSRRDHSVKELREKLLRTVDSVSADKAIDKMLDLGYLDDEKYTKSLLNYLIENKKMSKSFIKKEMYKRGIDNDIISNCLEEVEIDAVSSILDLLRSKYMTKLRPDENYQKNKEKVIASLMRKGFSYGDIKSAFYRLENEDEL